MSKLAPKIAKMRAQGKTVKEISQALDRSERYIYKVMKDAGESLHSMIVELPDPKANQNLNSSVKERIEYTAEGFEKFFNEYSGRTLQPIHKEWVKQALSSHRVLINCPPRHAKSTIFSVWFVIWLVAIDRDVQILICSQTDTLAKKFTNEIAHNLSYNTKLIKDFGRFRPELADHPWRPNSGELMVEGRRREVKSGDLTIQVRGAGQQILGMEANWVIVDDAVSRSNTKKETEREKLSEWFHGDVMSRLEPGGHATVIGQRLHIWDLYGELSAERIKTGSSDAVPRWEHLNYPAILTWPDVDAGVEAEVLWPEKWTFEALMEVYADTGEQLFESMYQQNPLPDGDKLAARAWIYGDETHPGCLDVTRNATERSGDMSTPIRVFALDPSPTRYAGLIVAELNYNRNYFEIEILEIVREKMQVRDMINHIERVVAWYQPQYFVFEQNAAQRWFLQDPIMDRLRRVLRIVPHTTAKNKGDPVLGIESLSTDFEFGRIRIPYGDAETKAMSQLLIDEILTYPQGQTDDLLMALWFLKFNFTRLVPTSGSGLSTGGGGGFAIPDRLKHGWWWTKSA